MMLSMFNLSRIQAGKLSLQVATGPASGPPLVMLHGVLRCWRDFANLWPALMPRWQVYAIDHRGHGGSDRGSAYHVRDYAADMIALFQTHLPDNAVIYGHSLGALVAIAVANACPEKVQAIILEEPPSPSLLRNVIGTPWFAVWSAMRDLAGSDQPVRVVARQLADIRQPTPQGETRLGDLRDPAAIRFIARCLKDVDRELFPPLLSGRWLHGFDEERVSRGVRCPTLLLRGDITMGGMMGRAEAEELLAYMEEGLLVDVPGVGHLIHTSAPEATLRLVQSFLESL